MGVGDADEDVSDVVELDDISDVEEVDVVELLELETADFFLYKLNLLPAPQYSLAFPAQSILHCVETASVEPTPRVFPHQHSLLLEVRKVNDQ